MEANYEGLGENRQPALPSPPDTAMLDIMRTETVLSRLPVHNLAKTGRVDIRILKTTPTGEIELKWEVSYSDRYGQARQLAYKLDTIIVNQRIDEAGRPLPKILRIGSLNEICAELNLATHAGQNTKDLKRAFLQNASLFITAKFKYTANDKTERQVEAGITRYGVIFTGEKLPDGRKADAVYIVFNDPFWEVLNNAPVRPLDRAYMKELPPAAQRFYELVSRKIFAALKNHYPHAKLSYSEYCTFSAQLRHYERQKVQDQMAKVLRSHKKSGYIAAVKYEPTIDGENKPDWNLYLTPGPRAEAEFAAVHRRKARKILVNDNSEAGDREPHLRIARREHPVKTQPATASHSFDPQLVAEFTRRGITEKKAVELLANLKPGQDVVAQLEFGEYMVQHPKVPIQNPPGFLIRLVESNTSIPESFETSAKRKARQEQERQDQNRREQEEARQMLEWEYDDYCQFQTDQFIEQHPDIFEALNQEKWNATRERHQSFSGEMITTIAIGEAKREMRRRLALPTFEEFVELKKQGTDFSMKPVKDVSLPVSDPALGAERAIAPEPAVSLADQSIESVSEPSNDSQADGERESATNSRGDSAPASFEGGPMMIELISEPPPPPGGDTTEPPLV